MSIKVTYDLKNIKNMTKILKYLKSHKVEVGFIGNEKGENGTPVVEYAYYVEFGAGKGNVPRPFFRNAKGKIDETLTNMLEPLVMQAVRTGSNGKAILTTIGEEMVGILQESIANGSYAANKESTLKNKSGTKPLIDTGTMQGAVDFRIVSR